MKKNYRLTPVVIGALALCVTVLIYVLIFDNLLASAIAIISLGFLCLAEVMMILKSTFGSKTIIIGAQNFVSVIHIISVIVVSIIYVGLFESRIKAFCIINVVLLLIAAVADILIYQANKGVEQSQKQLSKTQNEVGNCIATLESIIVANSQSPLKKELSQLLEMIKYSDNTVLSDNHEDIKNEIVLLGQNLQTDGENEELINEQIEKIKILLENRNIYIKQKKRGNF